MNIRSAAWVVLVLPALAAVFMAAYTDMWVYPVIFALGYLAAAIFSIRWGPEGWVLVFAAGEPLVLTTAAVSLIAAALVQIAVLWAAMLTGWKGESGASAAGWALLGGGIVGVVGIVGTSSAHASSLLTGAALAGIAAVAAVWLGELHLKKKVGIQR